MSSGVLALPLVLLVAPLALAAIAGGAVVVLAARAAAAGTEALACGLVSLGEQMECQEQAYVEAQRAADLWQAAVAEVVDRNARIAALTALARSVRRSAGTTPDVPIPPPLDVTGRRLPQIHAWCTRTDDQLNWARTQLSQRAAAAARQRIAASLPAAHRTLVSAAEALADQQAALAVRAAATPAAASADPVAAQARVTASVAEEVEKQLASIDPEARPEDRARAIAAAAEAATADPPRAGWTHADHLQRIVTHANKRAGDARTAARYLQGVRLDLVAGELDRQDRAVLSELDTVVSGQRELDEQLDAAARRVMGKAEAAGLRLYVREQVKQIMQAQGLEPEGDFTTLRPGMVSLTLSAADWDEHHLRIVIDNDQVRYMTLRDHEVKGDAATRLDRERCDQAAAAMRQLAGTLKSRGVDQADIRAQDDQAVRYLAQPPAASDSQQDHSRLRLPEPGTEGR